ncbi:MAG: hypothetical protein AAB414_00145 [Patescibacteria group bacterium]
MRTLIVVLIICAFLQSTILPLDLVLIILICRAFLKIGKANLYLAFAFGLLISHLTLIPLGLQSIGFLVLVQITQSLSRSRLSINPISLVSICFVAIALNQIIVWMIYGSIQFVPKIYGGFLSLAIFYLVRFWEERFIVRKEIKLKI